MNKELFDDKDEEKSLLNNSGLEKPSSIRRSAAGNDPKEADKEAKLAKERLKKEEYKRKVLED